MNKTKYNPEATAEFEPHFTREVTLKPSNALRFRPNDDGTLTLEIQGAEPLEIGDAVQTIESKVIDAYGQMGGHAIISAIESTLDRLMLTKVIERHLIR